GVGAAERAEREVEQWVGTAGLEAGGPLERGLGLTDARAQSVPRRSESARPLVVGLGRVDVEIQPGRFVDELELWQRRRPRLSNERVEVFPHRPVCAI